MSGSSRQQRLTDIGNTSGTRKKNSFNRKRNMKLWLIFFLWVYFLFSSTHLSFSLLSFSLSLNVSGLSISVISVPTSNGPNFGIWEGFSFCRAVRFPASCFQYFKHVQKVHYFTSASSLNIVSCRSIDTKWVKANWHAREMKNFMKFLLDDL